MKSAAGTNIQVLSDPPQVQWLDFLLCRTGNYDPQARSMDSPIESSEIPDLLTQVYVCRKSAALQPSCPIVVSFLGLGRSVRDVPHAAEPQTLILSPAQVIMALCALLEIVGAWDSHGGILFRSPGSTCCGVNFKKASFIRFSGCDPAWTRTENKLTRRQNGNIQPDY